MEWLALAPRARGASLFWFVFSLHVANYCRVRRRHCLVTYLVFLPAWWHRCLDGFVWTISPQHDHTLIKFSPSLRRRGSSPGPQPLHPLVTSINKPRQSFGNSLQLAAFMWNCPGNSRWQTILCFSHWILDSIFVPFCLMLIRCLLLIWWFDTLDNYLCMLVVCDEPGKLVWL